MEEQYLIVPCTIIVLTRNQTFLFRHVETEFGRPDPFDDAGDDPDYAEDAFLVDFDDLQRTNPEGARWLAGRGYPSVAGCRVTPYAGYDRFVFPETFPPGTWNGYWDVKDCALFMLALDVVQTYLGPQSRIHRVEAD